MAHNLAVIGGRTAMAYQGDTPWHGLGERFQSITSVDQALKAASLDWRVALQPMQFQALDGSWRPSTVRRSVVRDIDGAELGTVGKGYHAIQNADGFGVLQPACEEFGVTIEAAGALGNGERAWMLARMPEGIEPIAGDTINGYFCIVLGHDGTLSYHAKPTPVRVVCQNTLNAAFDLGTGKRVKDAMISIRHTASSVDRIAEAKRIVTGMIASMKKTETTFAQMAEKKMNARDVVNFIEQVFPNPNPEKELSDSLKARRLTVARLVWEGKGAELAGANANGANLWATYNAVTEYFDHVRPAEASKASAKLSANESALFGTGEAVKKAALLLAQRQLVAV